MNPIGNENPGTRLVPAFLFFEKEGARTAGPWIPCFGSGGRATRAPASGSAADQLRRLVLLDGDVKGVLELGTLEFQFVDLLVSGKFDVFLDAANFVIELVVFLEHLAKLSVGQLERTDGFAMGGEFNHERMVQIHWNSSGWKVNGAGIMLSIVMPCV
jgi:hypothetical protein